jgi:hypothetical protein
MQNTNLYWVNNSGTPVGWINNSSTVIPWIGGNGYFLYKSDAAQWGKYVGLTVQALTPGLTYNTFEFEHELRTRF